MSGGNSKEDFTGKSRLAHNVLWSWAGHLVFVVSGFVMPHMIDRYIGQRSLGIWDFCWSVISYIGLASLGIGQSVNRFVAQFRASGDVESLNRTVSSVVVIQAGIGIVALFAAAGIALGVRAVLNARFGADAGPAGWVVFLLGASVGVQMGLDAFRGVITGCHRWDLHNGIQAGAYGVTIIAMLLALKLGGGIVSLAVVYLIGSTAGELVRMQVALRVCPELRIRLKYASWADGRKVTVFGGKSVLLGVPPLLIIQATNIEVASVLGPAALAVLSRPLGLVRNAETFLNKFSYVLAPMVGSLRGAARDQDRRNLYLQATRWCVAFAFPAMVGLAILGDSVLQIWMGSHYVERGLVATLAIGSFLSMAQGPSAQILVGLDSHGRIGALIVVVVVLVLGIGTPVLNYVHWSIEGAALMVVLAYVIPYGFLLPVFACRRLGVSSGQYLRAAFAAPIAGGLPYVGVLLLVRWLFHTRPWMELGAGAAGGSLVLGVCYWRLLLTHSQRASVKKRLPDWWPGKGGRSAA